VRRGALLLSLAALPLVACGDDGSASVVVRDRDDGGRVTAAPLPASGRFTLAYRHSVYRVGAEERFRAAGDGAFVLESIASPSEAVLDYYALDGTRARRGGIWVLRPARPPRFDGMALAGTAVGRRTLVVAGRRTPLWASDGGVRHLRIEVER
jgi:hypothetical protein